mgnify:FL=1
MKILIRTYIPFPDHASGDVFEAEVVDLHSFGTLREPRFRDVRRRRWVLVRRPDGKLVHYDERHWASEPIAAAG